MPFTDSQKSRLNNELVEETKDSLIRLLHAFCADNADQAVAEENSRLTQEIHTLQTLGSVYAFEERNRASEQAATKRVFEVLHEMYNKKHESNRT